MAEEVTQVLGVPGPPESMYFYLYAFGTTLHLRNWSVFGPLAKMNFADLEWAEELVRFLNGFNPPIGNVLTTRAMIRTRLIFSPNVNVEWIEPI